MLYCTLIVIVKIEETHVLTQNSLSTVVHLKQSVVYTLVKAALIKTQLEPIFHERWVGGLTKVNYFYSIIIKSNLKGNTSLCLVQTLQVLLKMVNLTFFKHLIST